MDRFPEPVYAQGRDTHLYHFLTALCGDAGAGVLKKQAYMARLATETELLRFTELDTFYTQHFRFRRLKSELYDLDPDIEYLTPEEWDDIHKKDDSYKHRVQTFFNATRLGNSPEGMALAAEAGTGISTEIFENYKYIFDKYADDALGIQPVGETASVNEYVVLPRLVKQDGTVEEDATFTAALAKQVDHTFPSTGVWWPQTAARQANVSKGWSAKRNLLGSIVQLQANWSYLVASDYDENTYRYLLPELERNMLDVMDRLRPVGAFLSVYANQRRHIPITISGDVFASSEHFQMSRFVNGNPAVDWPDPDNEQGMFITAGVENQARHNNNAREWPIIFQSIEGVLAYDWRALEDPIYNTPFFYAPRVRRRGALPGYVPYLSEHTGAYFPVVRKLFPMFRNSPTDNTYAATKAIARQNTPLIMVARSR